MRIVIFCLLLGSALNVHGQDVEVIKYKDLAQMLDRGNGRLAVFNFWATWCRPCIKELPYFEKANQNFRDEGVKIYLVSLDFVEDLESKVIPFVKKKKLTSEIKLLDETDYNSFIDKIDPRWSGAIPATLIVDFSDNQHYFYEKEFDEGELDNTIREILN